MVGPTIAALAFGALGILLKNNIFIFLAIILFLFMIGQPVMAMLIMLLFLFWMGRR